MYEQQNKQNTFFQPCFQQLTFSRSMSKCSLFDNGNLDLNLEIEDVVDINHEDLQNYQFTFNERDYSMISEEIQEKLSSNGKIDNVEIEDKEIRQQQGRPLEEPKQEKSVSQFSKKTKKSKTPKTFYEKNICRNIIRKVIRMIKSGAYQTQLMQFCSNKEQFKAEFCRIMNSHLQIITSPSALKDFLQVQDAISFVFKKFSHWYLKERYIRDAINGGHMTNIDKYMSYKNKILLPMIDKL